jgi:hypothetical protein
VSTRLPRFAMNNRAIKESAPDRNAGPRKFRSPAPSASTYARVAVVLGAAGLLGCAIPARRAVRVDPLAALRHE